MTVFYGGRDLDTDGGDRWLGWVGESVKLLLVGFNAVAWPLFFWMVFAP